MESTLVDEDVIFIDKLTLLFREPQRGDVISVIRHDTDRKLVKRVIGLPGDQILLEGGYVTIYTAEGETILLGEVYVNNQGNTFPPQGESRLYDVIPEDSVFIMGDNRLHSVDSRVYGAVHRNEIVGLIRIRN